MSRIMLLFVVNSLMSNLIFHKTWMDRSEPMSEFVFSSKTYSSADEFLAFLHSLFKTVLCGYVGCNGR